MKNELPISTVILEVWGDDLHNPGGSDPDDTEVPDPVQKVIDAAILRKARTDVGLPAPTLAKTEWDEPIGATATPSADFVKSSDERFQKVVDKVHALFGDGEEAEELIAAAKEIRTQARAEVLATH
jgi:hypothetical protein